MVFGSKKRPATSFEEEDEVQDVEGRSSHYVDLSEEDHQSRHTSRKGTNGQDQALDDKPLLAEVDLIGESGSKNPGGTKVWVCKHCKIQFKSSYTRIHTHFFGTAPGKKADIRRCKALLKNQEAYERIQKRVKDAEKVGVSKSLKSSVVTKKPNLSSKSPLEQSFSIMERSLVDLKIVKALCANGIPFNVLRSPHFQDMVTAIRKAPEGYKAPSSEKARTVLLDECVRDVDKDLLPFKDTWYSQGLSIVSDGWTNVKHRPLINVLAVNSRGSMFMYAEDFSGEEKTGKAIADFLTKAIEEVGSNNVLSVVTDNAANCKAAGKEIEKRYKHIFWSPCCVHTLNLVFKDFANDE